MTLTFTPLVALVLGLLIGWVFGWLLQLFHFRRRRLACQRRLAELEGELTQRNAQIGQAQSHVVSLQADLAHQRASVVVAPTVIAQAPDITIPAAAATTAATVVVASTVEARTGACPQDLSRVSGIGPYHEHKLRNAGIGTYWDLAQASQERLAAIVKAELVKDLPAIQAHALKLAQETDMVGYSWDGNKPDDFDRIQGIGDVYEAKLYGAGICTYAALAACTVEQLQAICQSHEGPPAAYGQWIAQAGRLANVKG